MRMLGSATSPRMATVSSVAFDQLLHQHLALIASGECDGLRQIRFLEHASHADARAFARGLHDHRQTETTRRLLNIAVTRQARITRRRQTERQPHLFGADLVHRQRRAEHVRARVRNAERFQQTLQDAVFAAAGMAVQDVEHALATLVHQLIDQRRDAVDLVRIDALTLQRVQAIAAASRATLRAPTTCRPSTPRRDRSRAGW